MSRKNKYKPVVVPPSATPFLSKRGLQFVWGGVVFVVLGFWVVTFTDPAGRNWASHLSPFLLVGGYALIGVGLALRDPSDSSSSSTLPR